MRSYNATPLASGDSITAITFYKSPLTTCHGLQLQNVEVSSIANIGIGTVTARIGSTDDFAEMDKEELAAYINYAGYSLSP